MQRRMTNPAADRQRTVSSRRVQCLTLQGKSPSDTYHLAVQFGTVRAGLAAGGYPTKIGDAALLVAKASNRIAEPHRLVGGNLPGPPLNPFVKIGRAH